MEPEPATSTSTLDSDASVTYSSNPTTSHVNLPTAESAELVDQGARDDARDPEEAQIELSAGCEVASLALEINHEVGKFSLSIKNSCLSFCWFVFGLKGWIGKRGGF